MGFEFGSVSLCACERVRTAEKTERKSGRGGEGENELQRYSHEKEKKIAKFHFEKVQVHRLGLYSLCFVATFPNATAELIKIHLQPRRPSNARVQFGLLIFLSFLQRSFVSSGVAITDAMKSETRKSEKQSHFVARAHMHGRTRCARTNGERIIDYAAWNREKKPIASCGMHKLI